MKKTLLLNAAMLLVMSIAFAQENALLSTDAFQQAIAKDSVQLLDVRTAGEFQNNHIKNALQADWNKSDEFKDRVQYLDKSKPILIYCAVGGRSHAAAEWLRQNKFADVRELKGGLTAWKGDNKPVVEIKSAPQLSMDEYLALTKTHAKVLVDFGAEWCPPCKLMDPVVARVKAEMGASFELVKIDAGTQAALVKQMKLGAIPTFIIYEKGKETWRQEGVVPFNTLKKKLGAG